MLCVQPLQGHLEEVGGTQQFVAECIDVPGLCLFGHLHPSLTQSAIACFAWTKNPGRSTIAPLNPGDLEHLYISRKAGLAFADLQEPELTVASKWKMDSQIYLPLLSWFPTLMMSPFPSLCHHGQENRKCESGTVLGLILEPGKDRMERAGLGQPLLPALPDS